MPGEDFPSTDAVDSPITDERFGGWVPETRLGQGRFGSAYVAVGVAGQRAALKILRHPPGDEVRVLAGLSHPAIPNLLGAGAHPRPWLAMELAPGLALHEVLAERLLSIKDAVCLLTPLVDAAAVIHHAGLCHGDIKPANIVVRDLSQGEAWLVDFGMAGVGGAGGTLLYAAPERLRGADASASADVYSLGLVLWEALHGEVPWAELPPTEALARRDAEVPRPVLGPEWLQRLLMGMLAIDPAHRPAAATVSDTLEAQGSARPPITAWHRRRRARVVHVSITGVHDRISGWPDTGGLFALVGPPGSGRTHAFDRIRTEIRARGEPFVMLAAHTSPWHAVEMALCDPGLPGPPVVLPDEPDPAARAGRVAGLLRARAPTRLRVLVDDVDHLDSGSLAALKILATRRMADVFVTSARAPDWDGQVIGLPALDAEGLRALTHGLLGLGHLEAVIPWLELRTAGQPGVAIAQLIAALEVGAIGCTRRRWWVDESRLGGVPAPTSSRPLPELDPSERRIAGALAVVGEPITEERLIILTKRPPGEVRAATRCLQRAGLVRRVGALYRLTTPALAAALRPDPGVARTLHRSMLQLLLGESPPAFARLGRHLVAVGDRALACLHGAAVIAATARRSAVEGVEIGRALAALSEDPAVTAALVDACLTLGDGDAALQTIEVALRDPAWRANVPLWAAHMRVLSGFFQRPEAALTALAEAADRWPTLPYALLRERASAHFKAERYDAVIADAVEAGREPPTGEPSTLDRAEVVSWLRIVGLHAQARYAQGDLTGALTLLDRLPEELGEGTPERGLLYGVHARLLYHAGRMRDAARCLEQAGSERSGLPMTERAKLLNNRGLLICGLGDRPAAVRSWEDASTLFEQLGMQTELTRVRGNLCVGYRELGRWERARNAGEAAHRDAARAGLVDLQAMAAGNLGDLHRELGQPDQASTWYSRAQRIALKHDLTGELVELARRRAEIAVARGWPTALTTAREAVALAEQHEVVAELCRSRALVAVCLARGGEADEARSELEAARVPLRESGAAGELAEVRYWAAHALLELGEVAEAERDARRVAAYADEVHLVPLRKRADVLLSRISREAGPELKPSQIAQLMHLAMQLSRFRRVDSLLVAIADAAVSLLGADRAYVLQRRGKEYTVVASAPQGVPEGAPSMSIVERAFENRCEVMATDLDERGDLRAAPSVLALGIRAALCVPLISQHETLGVIYVDSRSTTDWELGQTSLLLQGLAGFAVEALNSARLRAEHASGLAHDLRSPLSSIMLAAQYLGECADPFEFRDMVKMIEEAARSALELTGKALKARGERLTVELGELTRRVCAPLYVQARSRGVALLVDAPREARTLGDDRDLGRVLQNLLVNALQHSPRGGHVLVEVRVETDRVGWSVRDEGPGLPPELRETLFDVGVSGTDTGTGLGLAIVRRLVEEHRGTVDARDAPGGGALFEVWLPTQ